MLCFTTRPRSYFYPRSPCGERPSRLHKNICGWGFLSTLSLRRATIRQISQSCTGAFLSTLSLRRATVKCLPASPAECYFYPRSPCGERLLPSWELYQMLRISIHALLAESDLFLRCGPMTRRYFYPRSPCGERLCDGAVYQVNQQFLSTLSLRRAT